MRNISYVLVSVFLLLSSTTFAEGSAAKAKKIGILIPLSGNYAEVGSDNRQGIEVALSLLKQKPNVELVYGDSKSEPGTAVTEFKKMLAVDGILGLYAMRSPVGMAVNPISKTTGIPVLGGVGQKSFVPMNDYAWQVWSNSPDEGAFLADRILKKNFHKVAIITAQDDWTNDVSEGLRKSLEEKKVETVDYDMLPTEADFRTLISKIDSNNPDAVVVNLSLAQLGPFFKQARSQRLRGTFYSNFWIAKKQVVESAGIENIEGVRFVEMDTSLPVFKKTVADKFQSVPSGATLSAYVSTLLLMQEFVKSPEIDTASKLYQALCKADKLETPDGPIAIVNRHISFPLIENEMHLGKAERT